MLLLSVWRSAFVENISVQTAAGNVQDFHSEDFLFSFSHSLLIIHYVQKILLLKQTGSITITTSISSVHIYCRLGCDYNIVKLLVITTARRYTNAILAINILSVCPLNAYFVTKYKAPTSDRCGAFKSNLERFRYTKTSPLSPRDWDPCW